MSYYHYKSKRSWYPIPKNAITSTNDLKQEAFPTNVSILMISK